VGEPPEAEAWAEEQQASRVVLQASAGYVGEKQKSRSRVRVEAGAKAAVGVQVPTRAHVEVDSQVTAGAEACFCFCSCFPIARKLRRLPRSPRRRAEAGREAGRRRLQDGRRDHQAPAWPIRREKQRQLGRIGITGTVTRATF